KKGGEANPLLSNSHALRTRAPPPHRATLSASPLAARRSAASAHLQSLTHSTQVASLAPLPRLLAGLAAASSLSHSPLDSPPSKGINRFNTDAVIE
ncbi:hypothetical protein Dimus_018399, partial [Dionaea muscipula]